MIQTNLTYHSPMVEFPRLDPRLLAFREHLIRLNLNDIDDGTLLFLALLSSGKPVNFGRQERQVLLVQLHEVFDREVFGPTAKRNAVHARSPDCVAGC